MAKPLVAGLPPDLVLASGYVIRLTALDPSTGAAVGGVNLSDIAFQVRNVGESAGDIDGLAPMPLLVPQDDGTGG